MFAISVYNKNLQLELYTCWATATNSINRTAATITNSSQFTCLNTAPNVDEKRRDEKKREKKRRERKRTARDRHEELPATYFTPSLVATRLHGE